MYEISVKINVNEVDNIIEKLLINDIYNTFYEAPLEITTDKYGYGYIEKDNEDVVLKVLVEDDNTDEVNKQKKILKDIILSEDIEVKHLENTRFQQEFEPIDLNNGWIIASPEYEVHDKNKINFYSQGAFGTGLHETTQDCLRIILSEDFTNKKVMDIGTGSGILSIASAIKNAKLVSALDIRNVTEEIDFNSSLNNLSNIEVLVGDAINDDIKVNHKYDWVYINIGGEETKLFMNFINSIIKSNGTLMISGLVEWSFNEVISNVLKYGYELKLKTQTNEWCTCLLSKI
ncbi:[LSU ribosomal protein L11P]-lysine N-methyltransferase [Clostridium cavendishii DSM 21758]|uniref:[LSU ribosomal protein L11P]-lysine N-methyltransferase n=1 Tax=Clostridium cavendishii DSM 21758 TaxID=1121302 RepID=A0A1M6ARU3_9CLOT|nr:50S ribosomal protein L11 methyltransferase [Clostridium cavendishii]SHI39190.1 [LSU ribosomal protein L11P]-lysine N-methyltransferase [Clostridium cavendishii DSM 21758]